MGDGSSSGNSADADTGTGAIPVSAVGGRTGGGNGDGADDHPITRVSNGAGRYISDDCINGDCSGPRITSAIRIGGEGREMFGIEGDACGCGGGGWEDSNVIRGSGSVSSGARVCDSLPDTGGVSRVNETVSCSCCEHVVAMGMAMVTTDMTTAIVAGPLSPKKPMAAVAATELSAVSPYSPPARGVVVAAVVSEVVAVANTAVVPSGGGGGDCGGGKNPPP